MGTPAQEGECPRGVRGAHASTHDDRNSCNRALFFAGAAIAGPAGGDYGGQLVGQVTSIDRAHNLLVLDNFTELRTTDPRLLANLHEGMPVLAAAIFDRLIHTAHVIEPAGCPARTLALAPESQPGRALFPATRSISGGRGRTRSEPDGRHARREGDPDSRTHRARRGRPNRRSFEPSKWQVVKQGAKEESHEKGHRGAWGSRYPCLSRRPAGARRLVNGCGVGAGCLCSLQPNRHWPDGVPAGVPAAARLRAAGTSGLLRTAAANSHLHPATAGRVLHTAASRVLHAAAGGVLPELRVSSAAAVLPTLLAPSSPARRRRLEAGRGALPSSVASAR